MKLQVKKWELLYFIILSMATVFLLIKSLYESIAICDVLFWIDIFLFFMIVIRAQFSIMSLWTLISNYMLINVYYVYKTGMGYGNLQRLTNIYMFDIAFALLIFNIILVGWAYLSRFLYDENKVLTCDIPISKVTARILAGLAIIMSFIAFPNLGFGFADTRFQALLPGHFWNHFSVVFLIFATAKIKESRFVKLCLIIVTVWFLSHGERVDMIGLYSYLLIKYCVIKKYHFNVKSIVKLFLPCTLAFLLLIYIGGVREGYTFSADKLISSVFSQGTASDIGHVFNGTIDYVKKNGLLYGKTFITYIQGMFPFLNQPFRAGAIIADYYKTAGGEFFLTEPMLNYGYLGIIVLVNLYIGFIYKINKKNTKYGRIVSWFLTATAFRYLWYGLTYIQTALVYLIPCVAIFIKFLPHTKSFLQQKKQFRRTY